MKKLLMGLGLMALLVGCASHDSSNGMGGTSDESNQSMKTDTYNSNNKNSSDQFHNNASNGTGSVTATNRGTATTP